VNEIGFLADPGRGELRVGFGEVAAAGLVPAAIARLARRHPRMTVQTEQGQIATVIDFLRNRRCEVAVGRQNSAAPDLISEPIHFEQLYVVVAAASKWARARRVRLADPADEAWVQSPVELETGSPTLEAFRAAGLSGPRVVFTSASMNVRYGESGRFITMIPDSALYYGSKRAAVKGVANKATTLARPCSRHNGQRPHPKPNCTPLHRLPSRSRKADRKTPLGVWLANLPPTGAERTRSAGGASRWRAVADPASLQRPQGRHPLPSSALW
jgi:DNA-binding transcriptional LysR family regulator